MKKEELDLYYFWLVIDHLCSLFLLYWSNLNFTSKPVRSGTSRKGTLFESKRNLPVKKRINEDYAFASVKYSYLTSKSSAYFLMRTLQIVFLNLFPS